MDPLGSVCVGTCFLSDDQACEKNRIGAIHCKLENGAGPIRVLYKYRFSILVFHPLCCWIMRGVIGACGALLGKERFDVKWYGTKMDYSYIFDKKYVLFYFVGTIILSVMIGFVIRGTYELVRPGIEKLFRKAGINTDRITVEKQFVLIMTIIACIIFAIGVIVSISTIWLFKTWDNLNIYELVYTITSPIEGTNPEMVRDCFVKYGTIEAGIIITVIVVLILIRKKKKASKVMRIAISCLGVLLTTGTFVYANSRLGIIRYIKNLDGNSSFAREIYVNPMMG